jgi:hypothetical protein
MEQVAPLERERRKRKKRGDENWQPFWKKLKDVWYELAVIVNTVIIH